jgi:hypothetical protein
MYLGGLIHGCVGLDVMREAYRTGDDTVVFDFIRKTGTRPSCRCGLLDDGMSGTQCIDLVLTPDGGGEG